MMYLYDDLDANITPHKLKLYKELQFGIEFRVMIAKK